MRRHEWTGARRTASTLKVLAALAVAVAAGLAWTAPAAAQNVRARGVDSLHVRANIQPQLDGTTVDDEPAVDWRLRRARIGLRVWAAGWLRGDVEADFGRGRAVLTDAYARLDFDRAFRLRMGQYKKPFDALELTSSRELVVVERDGTPRGAAGPTPNGLVGDLGYSDRDIGIEYSGSFERFSATAGIWNGSGSNTSDDDDGKQVAARLGVEVADGWELAGAWTANRLDVPVPGAAEPDGEWFQAYELALTGGEYGEPGFQGLAQLMAGDNHDPELGGGPESSFRVFQAIAAWHVAVFDSPWIVAWEPAARVGWADPDTDADDDEATLLTAGINLYHHEHVKTMVGLDRLSPAGGDSETALRVMAVFEF